jgi:flagellar motor switch/type III secretory pathway protein FliN
MNAIDLAARPLVWLPPEQLEVARAAIVQTVNSWCTAWGIDGPVDVVCREVAADDRRVTWTQDADGGLCWLDQDAGLTKLIHRRLFESDGSYGQAADRELRMTWATAHRAGADLVRHVSSEARRLSDGPKPTPRPTSQSTSLEQCLRPHAGFAVATIRIDATPAMRCLMRIGTPRRIVGRGAAASLSTLANALQAKRVTVYLQVGELPLTLGELATAGAGDILTLDAPLDHPLKVQLADGTALCSAFVGQQNGRRALRLTAT